MLLLVAVGIGWLAIKAEIARRDADHLTSLADHARQSAEAARANADHLASLADETRQSAVALKLGAQAQQAVSRPYGMGVETGVLLASESLHREANLDAFRALTAGLAVLPRPAGSLSLWSGVGKDAWLSPCGRYAVMAEGDGDDVRNLAVKETAHGRQVGVIATEKDHSYLVAFSSDGEFVLMGASELRKSGANIHDYTWFQVFRLRLVHVRSRPGMSPS